MRLWEKLAMEYAREAYDNVMRRWKDFAETLSCGDILCSRCPLYKGHAECMKPDAYKDTLFYAPMRDECLGILNGEAEHGVV